MLVYVPKIFDIFERIQDSSEISMPELFSKSIFWIWIIGSDCKLKLAQIPEKPQKSLLNNFAKKVLKTHFLISLCFECSEYWLQFTSVEDQEKQDSSENWLAGLTFFLFVLTYIRNPQAKKMICGFFLNLLECSNKATFLEQKGTKLEQWFSSAFCLLSLQKQFKTETKQKRKANFESRFGFFNLSKKRNTKSSDKLRKIQENRFSAFWISSSY